MPDIESLRLKTGQVVTEDWYDSLVDTLNWLAYGGAVSVYGVVTKDLVPAFDLELSLGTAVKRFKAAYAGAFV